MRTSVSGSGDGATSASTALRAFCAASDPAARGNDGRDAGGPEDGAIIVHVDAEREGGAIVVGDGTGAGNGATVDASSFEQPEASPAVQVRTVSGPASPAPSPTTA